MSFVAKKAARRNVKIKMSLQGVPGSGKTTSALLIAHGLEKDWSKIACIDTENESSLYNAGKQVGDTVIGEFQHIDFKPPYTPERYIEAFKYAASIGCTVIVCDSISHEWSGKGGLLEIHDNMPGNSYTNWSKLTPRHNAFIDAMRLVDAHVIACARTKQDHVIEQQNGKQQVKKVGMKTEQRDGTEYEFGLVFDIDRDRHLAKAGKDRTGLFDSRDPFLITSEVGEELLAWCNSGMAKELLEKPVEKEQPVIQPPVVEQEQPVMQAQPVRQEQFKLSTPAHAHLVTAAIKELGFPPSWNVNKPALAQYLGSLTIPATAEAVLDAVQTFEMERVK